MPKIHLKKSIDINASPEKIFQKISDLNHWGSWSPWLLQEPEATVDVSNQGKFYSWNGSRVGSGNMKVISEKPHKSVDYDLTFLTPWKSHAKVRFELSPKENGTTEVSWLMDSSLPFFMFWMKKMMLAFIGMDYQRGLNLLKDLVEDGEVHSKLEFIGKSTYTGCDYIGIKRECDMQDLSVQMAKDFESLRTYFNGKEDEIASKAFTIYHKWDMANSRVSYTSGVPVKKMPDNAPEGMVTGTLPATTVHKLRHTGPYRHLGNAWTTLNSMHRNKEFKLNKRIHPFELYINNPGEVAENELITEVLFPMK